MNKFKVLSGLVLTTAVLAGCQKSTQEEKPSDKPKVSSQNGFKPGDKIPGFDTNSSEKNQGEGSYVHTPDSSSHSVGAPTVESNGHSTVTNGSVVTRVESLTAKPVEKPTPQPVEKPVEKPTPQPVEKPVEKPTPQPVEKPVEKPTSQPVEKPVEKPTSQPVEKPVEKPVTQPVEKPVEKPVTQPVEKPAEKPVTQPVEKPAEKPVTRPEAVVTEKGEPEVQPALPEAVVTEKGKPEVQPALPEAVVSEKGQPEVQPALPEAVVSEKGQPEVQPALPEAVVSEKGEPKVQPALPEAVVTENTPMIIQKGEPLVQPTLPEAVVTEKGETLVQPTLPEAVVTEKGEPLVQPTLPELVVTEKGEPEVRPALPEAVVTEKGEPLVQPVLPELVVTEKGEPEVRPALPELVVTEKGEPLVQPALPELVVTEKGEPLVQPALPEFDMSTIHVPVTYEKGTPEIRDALPEFTLTTRKRTATSPIKPGYVMLASMFLPEGKEKVDFPGKDGVKEEELEELVGPDGKVYNSKVLSSKETKPILMVKRYGTLKPGADLGNTGLYNIREHFPDADFMAFNRNIKEDGKGMLALSADTRYAKSKEQIENTLFLPGAPGTYTITNAPLSDETINKLNDGTYLNHKLIGQEMLKLVNEERERVGQKALKWSDNLYGFAQIRAREIGENGYIRFFNKDNQPMAHTRNTDGKEWDTVFDGTRFYHKGYGENTAGYTMPRNIYEVFSEKAIAERLFKQWKASPGHYANMIHDGYGYFAFDVQASKFWRLDKDNIDYLAQGMQGVQMFGGLKFE